MLAYPVMVPPVVTPASGRTTIVAGQQQAADAARDFRLPPNAPCPTATRLEVIKRSFQEAELMRPSGASTFVGVNEDVMIHALPL